MNEDDLIRYVEACDDIKIIEALLEVFRQWQ
jgi:hypothetical protein